MRPIITIDRVKQNAEIMSQTKGGCVSTIIGLIIGILIVLYTLNP